MVRVEEWALQRSASWFSINEMTIDNSGAGTKDRQKMMQMLVTNEVTKVTMRGCKVLQFDNSDAILKVLKVLKALVRPRYVQTSPAKRRCLINLKIRGVASRSINDEDD